MEGSQRTEEPGQGCGEAPRCPPHRVEGRVGTGLGQRMNVRGQCLEGSHSLQTGPCSLVEPQTSRLDWADALGLIVGRTSCQQLSGTERRR